MKRVRYVGPPGRLFPDLHWEPALKEEREVPDDFESPFVQVVPEPTDVAADLPKEKARK